MSIAVFISAAFMAVALSFHEVELVTVSDNNFTLTWTTDREAATGVRYGTDPKKLDGHALRAEPVGRFHQVTVDGLSPGTTYYYRIEGGSSLWPKPPLPPKSVATLVPPSGSPLFSFAVMNDLHAMEDIAGVIIVPPNWTVPLTPGFTWRNPVDNYWEFTLRAAVEGINSSDAELCIVNGDLTSWYTRQEFEAVKSYLDKLSMPYYVTRGNHDRVGGYSEDYFKAVFGLESSWYGVDHRGFHFVVLDDNRPEDGWHGFPDAELEWFEADLAGHRDMPTFIFMHRPIGSSFGADVNEDIRVKILTVISNNPQVVAVFNAHSHRARAMSVPELTGDVLYIEVPSTKEYPSGFGMVKVYEGGFLYNFIGIDCRDCREWRHITRKEYFGQAPRILMNEVTDRNLVHGFRPEVKKMIGSRK